MAVATISTVPCIVRLPLITDDILTLTIPRASRRVSVNKVTSDYLGVTRVVGNVALNAPVVITSDAWLRVNATEWPWSHTLAIDANSPAHTITVYLYSATASAVTGTFSANADYSGTVAGTVKHTDVAHGLVTGESVIITGTTNYNGTFSITRIDADNFYVTDTYVSNEATGTWSAADAYAFVEIE